MHNLTGCHIPNIKSWITTCRAHIATIWRESDIAESTMSRKRPHHLRCANVPHDVCPIIATGCKIFAVWREGNILDNIRVPGKDMDCLSGGDIPEPGSLITTTGCKILVVW